MASSGRNKTKYTYKGNNNKADNKYANIFQDLNEKEELYKSNLLSKIHETDENSDENIADASKLVITTISAEEAELNAKKRRQAAKNQKRFATRKSSPVVENEKNNAISKQESIEKLKKEKMASKNTEIDLSGEDKQNTSVFSFSEKSEESGNEGISESYFDDIDYIRQKARERAMMDKSDVKIYKEYSDFDKPVDSKEEKNKKINKEDKLSVSKIEKNLKEQEKKKNSESGYVEDETTIFEIKKNKEDVKAREEEIEKILRLKDEKLGDDSRNTTSRRRDRKKDEPVEKTSKASRRSEVYKKNTAKNTKKINFKKIFGVIIIIAVIIIGVSAAMDRLKSSKQADKNSISTSQVSTQKKKETGKEKKKESLDEKKSKLEAIKSKLNADESKRVDYIIDNIDSYPSELIDKLINNPETVDYVYSYKDKNKYNAKPLAEGITSSYFVDGDVPLFLQWDRRWGYRNYGKEMIGLSGCGPTSLAMVIKHFDKNADVNPYTVAQYSQKHGYVSNENFTSWKLFEDGLKTYGLESRDLVPVEAKMKRALDNGQILVASVKPGIFTQRGHIIVIKGYNSKGDFLINDPNSIINTNKTWSFDELKNEIRKIWSISEIGSSNSSEDTDSKQQRDNNKKDSNDSTGSSDDPSIIQDIE